MQSVTEFRQKKLLHIAPYAVLAAILFFQHQLAAPADDDISFFTLSTQYSLFDFLVMRYQTWSSRLLIESVVYYSVQHYTLWTVCNALIWAALAFGLNRLFGNKEKSVWIAVALCLLIPPSQFNNAGWIATEVNYIWPISMGLIAFLPVRRDIRMNGFRRFLCALALLFACNLEQLCPVLLVFYGLFTIKAFLIGSKKRWIYLVQTVLAMLSLAFILLCPGNSARMTASLENCLPGYLELNLFRKLEMGFSATFYHYLLEPNMIYIAFAGMLTICVYQARHSSRSLLAASIPLALGLFFGLFPDVFSGIYPMMPFYTGALGKFGTYPLLENIVTLFPDILLLTACAFTMLGVWLAFADSKEKAALAVLLLLAGFCSRMILAFSPTIWDSNTRTFLIMDICLFAVLLQLYRKICDMGKLNCKRVIDAVFACIAVYSVFMYTLQYVQF